MRSKIAIGGHPIHPMLVPLPIGLFIWALVSIIVYTAGDRAMLWYDMAFWSAVGGLVTAVLAGLAGFGDAMTVARYTRARAMAFAHGLMNVAVSALYLIAVLLMIDDNAVEGGALGAVVTLMALGTGILALSGWLGGELVYKFHLGMIPEDEQVAQEEVERHALEPRQRPGAQPR